MTFELFPWRFCFVAREAICFPRGKAANTLRGALGLAFAAHGVEAYQRWFSPENSGLGASGFRNLPRPFVLRPRALDGVVVEPGNRFYFDVHVFDVKAPWLELFVAVMQRLGSDGIGPGRGRAALESVWRLDGAGVSEACVWDGGRECGAVAPLVLAEAGGEARRLRVCFLSPTELKGAADRPEFGVLFGRARDRVSKLRALYGAGALELDYRGMGERAAAVAMTACRLEDVTAERRSARTGQTHGLGGFVGEVEYSGSLGEFLPILKAAEWTGVGRQTVWGKGEIRCELMLD